MSVMAWVKEEYCPVGPTDLVPLIGAAEALNPVRFISKGLLAPSTLLATCSAADLVPKLVGANRIVKVVLPSELPARPVLQRR